MGVLSLKEQIAVKKKDGIVTFYTNRENAFCVRENGAVTKLITDTKGNVDVVYGPEGTIHAVCCNNDILYLSCSDGKWKKQVVLKSKSSVNLPDHFKLFLNGGHVHLLYIIHYNEKKLLVHQLADNNEVMPNVLSEIKGNFIVTKDQFENPYLFFHNGTSLGYLRGNIRDLSFENFCVLAIKESICDAFIDERNDMHLVCRNGNELKYYLVRDNKIEHSSLICNFIDYEYNPCFIYDNGQLWILWEYLDNIYCSKNLKPTETVSTSRLVSNGGTAPVLYLLKFPNEQEYKIAKRCYGYKNENGKINLYILSDFLYHERREPDAPIAGKAPEIEMTKFQLKLSEEFESMNKRIKTLSNEVMYLKSIIRQQEEKLRVRTASELTKSDFEPNSTDS